MTTEFVASVEKFAREAGRSVEDTAQAIVTNLFSSVIYDTPVGNPDLWKDQAHAEWAVANGYTGGRARGNWQLTSATPAHGTLELSGTAGQAAADALVASFANTIQPGEVHYLTNNLPYVARIEYDGWSSQQPAGMVRKNVARLAAVIPGIVREHAR